MPLADLPLSLLFLLFLLIFVLIGLYPAWKKSAARIRQILKSLESSPKVDAGTFRTVQTARHSGRRTLSGPLNSYEVLVFRRLARSEREGCSRKQLGADLHLMPANIKQALQSLSRRGLVEFAVTQLLGIRFYLSEKGRIYAIKQDIIPTIRQNR
jgi:hypothetical protein